MPISFPRYTPPTDPYLDVIHEDEGFLVINKPSGLLSVSGKTPDLRDCVEYRAGQEFGWIKAIHRLDMETSGIITLARNKAALAHIGKQFEKRETKKRYVARLWGNVVDDEGEIDLPLICDWPNRPKQMVDHERGKNAVTRYRVLEREGDATRVEFTPITGRSHQLRVHALSIGHPILGDPLYAEGAALAAAARLQLHAEYLSFRHPVTDEVLEFLSPTPF